MVTVRFGADGRVLVPVELRRELGVQAGEPLVARVDDGRLVIERRTDAVSGLQRRFAGVPAGVSLVDELLADRRGDRERDQP
jgi:bifunctional DNA-binding transcriptional regulator/antitoxin component of YhaV-PrlF toxin-antitoxin module